VSVLVAAGRRFLPRGYADLVRQLAIWFGFLAAYQAARGIADRNPPRAFENGLQVIGIERHAHALIELTLQRIVDGSQLLATLVSWTYWNSEFTVVGLALLFVYLRRHEAFVRFRNAILLANVIGLVGYVLLPTAPPRMFPDLGFADTLADFGALNHGSGLIEVVSNPYAAMPSLHSADALIVGIVLFSVCRNRFFKAAWLLWPAWVWFAVMGTGNHFWLDVVGGVVVAAIALAIVYRPGWFRIRRRRVAQSTATA
jgi:membrane-associated phospholipid phosphatase